MNSHDTLIQRLADHLSSLSTRAGEPCPPAAQIITTHISSLILVGDYVYKLKRPVKLPFLDYSELAQRHAACVEEWIINQRTAPELYLGVRPILGSATHPVLGTTETCAVLDWLVLMRRFPAQHLFSDLARQARLSFKLVTALAEHVAHFHAHCLLLVSGEAQSDTQQWFVQSLQEIAPQRQDAQTRTQLDALQTYSTNHWQQMQSHRETRRSQGMVRDCHGDMHLGNITLFESKVMAFDAIDFNRVLRCMDVMDEAAFIFMDLCAHHLRSHAWHFLNNYLHLTGDYAGLAMFEYYVRYRAVVRAKVALLNHADSHVFERYWQLSHNPHTLARQPELILISGLSGSGKSTAAQLLSRQMGAIWLRADIERKRLFSEPTQRYNHNASITTYQHLAHTTQTLLASGYPVIVDATFQDQWQIDIFEASIKTLLAQGVRTRMHAVVCQAPLKTMQTRITERLSQGNDPSEATPAVLQAQYQKHQQQSLHWPTPTHWIHNDGSLENLSEQLTDWLEQHGHACKDPI